jgi:hypothetical protein
MYIKFFFNGFLLLINIIPEKDITLQQSQTYIELFIKIWKKYSRIADPFLRLQEFKIW